MILSQCEKCGRQSLNLIFMTQFSSQNQPPSPSREGSFWSRLRHLFEKAVIGIKYGFSGCSLCQTLRFYSNRPPSHACFFFSCLQFWLQVPVGVAHCWVRVRAWTPPHLILVFYFLNCISVFQEQNRTFVGLMIVLTESTWRTCNLGFLARADPFNQT